MKYKRQLISGMFAIALLAGGSSVYAADTTVGNTKTVHQMNQIKMKSPHEESALHLKELSGTKLAPPDGTTQSESSSKKTKKAKSTLKSKNLKSKSPTSNSISS